MPASFQQLRATLSSPLLAAFALSAGFLAFVAWDQSHWWRVKEDYAFGWLVPALVVFVISDRWSRIVSAVQGCMAAGSARAGGWSKWLLRGVAAGSLICGVLLFLLGAFYRAGAGTSQPGTLAITLGAVGIVLPLIFLNAPVPGDPAPANSDEGSGGGTGVSPVVRPLIQPEPGWDAPAMRCGLFSDARVRLTALFLFPVLVWLVSAPMVSAIESQLSLFLLRKVVTVVSFVFDLLGLPIEQQGNVLVLPTGKVGVEDACSGIRSLTGCLFAGSFLAAVFVERLGQKILLVVAALGLAFLTNMVRGLFLTGWAYHYGPEAIGGKVHDIAGYSVLGLTVLGLLGLLPLFKWATGESEKQA
ncbi:exosortase/archaeosortase family protein [Opitutus terrae]|uniref:Eight transmembrane protein EpsH n=1 Tax=Opitutus terrae (strain DSM 11246 / JCM 15787 / PB90-1) TaxID=452637 RepID=B1ZT21_OPITP|nr:exosortase/archaeosortase family protein [Opitutus terrae]ACB75810.1 hypothetical protein Oter_2528 [Opitutus terrae PB90-1]